MASALGASRRGDRGQGCDNAARTHYRAKRGLVKRALRLARADLSVSFDFGIASSFAVSTVLTLSLGKPGAEVVVQYFGLFDRSAGS